ncbi:MULTISPECIES: hypothetical protein [Nocardia]|uniref:hypothetical protein n=1 Tax=Nocardia TaxID=1817 RepID=UPI002454F5C1|nr:MULTISPECIES: hypothetical protein [Nocardia]
MTDRDLVAEGRAQHAIFAARPDAKATYAFLEYISGVYHPLLNDLEATRARLAQVVAERDAAQAALDLINKLAAHLGSVARETKQILGIDVTAVDDEIPATVRAVLKDRDRLRARVAELETTAIKLLAAHRRIAELEAQVQR